MGATESKTVAQHCKFSKQQFNYLLAIIKDSHSVMQFYASSKLLGLVPVNFIEYRTYSPISEEFFNSRRNDNDQVNYYQVYNFISNFKEMYEKLPSEASRSEALDKAFNHTYSVVRKLIDELDMTCEPR